MINLFCFCRVVGNQAAFEPTLHYIDIFVFEIKQACRTTGLSTMQMSFYFLPNTKLYYGNDKHVQMYANYKPI